MSAATSIVFEAEAAVYAVYGQAAVSALLCYEGLLTFEREQRVMWPGPIGLGKVLYFSIRYLTIFFFIPVAAISLIPTNLMIPYGLYVIQFGTSTYILMVFSQKLGTIAQRLPWIASVIITMLTETTLSLRLYALYRGKKSIIVALGISLFVTIVPMLVVGIAIICSETGRIVQDSVTRKIVCIASDATNDYIGFWIPAMVNEAFLFSLAAYKGMEVFRERRELGFTVQLKLFLVKGSVIYFFVVFATLLITEVMWLVAGATFVASAIALTAPVASLMSQHLLLSLRERYQKEQRMSTSTVSDFVVAPAVSYSDRCSNVGAVTCHAEREGDWFVSFSN